MVGHAFPEGPVLTGAGDTFQICCIRCSCRGDQGAAQCPFQPRDWLIVSQQTGSLSSTIWHKKWVKKCLLKIESVLTWDWINDKENTLETVREREVTVVCSGQGSGGRFWPKTWNNLLSDAHQTEKIRVSGSKSLWPLLWDFRKPAVWVLTLDGTHVLF